MNQRERIPLWWKVSITTVGVAAISASLPTQLTNAGQVQDSAGIGIALGGGATVANSGLIHAGKQLAWAKPARRIAGEVLINLTNQLT